MRSEEIGAASRPPHFSRRTGRGLAPTLPGFAAAAHVFYTVTIQLRNRGFALILVQIVVWMSTGPSTDSATLNLRLCDVIVRMLRIVTVMRFAKIVNKNMVNILSFICLAKRDQNARRRGHVCQ